MPALAETRSPKVLLSSFSGQFSIVNHCFIILNRLIPQMKKKNNFQVENFEFTGWMQIQNIQISTSCHVVNFVFCIDYGDVRDFIIVSKIKTG